MKYDLRLKGFVGEWNFDSDYVDYILDKFADRKVDVLIDSTGGKVPTALSISAAFRNHGNVHVHFVSMNASAATIASLGAKEITMDAQALYLVHRCSKLICEFDNLNAEQIDAKCEELLKIKKDLETLDVSIAAAYAKRCKKTSEELHALMVQETWLTAEEALDWGFVDSITEYDEDPKPVLDEITACAFVSAGVPIPELKSSQLGKSFASKLIDKFIASIRPKHKPLNLNFMEPSKDPKTDPATQDPMDASAQRESQPADDNSVDNVIARKDKEIEDLKAEHLKQVNDLKAEIAELKKQPGDEHSSVVDNPQGKSEQPGFLGTVKSARALYDALP